MLYGPTPNSFLIRVTTLFTIYTLGNLHYLSGVRTRVWWSAVNAKMESSQITIFLCMLSLNLHNKDRVEHVTSPKSKVDMVNFGAAKSERAAYTWTLGHCQNQVFTCLTLQLMQFYCRNKNLKKFCEKIQPSLGEIHLNIWTPCTKSEN